FRSDRSTAIADRIGRLRERTARLSLYPVPDADRASIVAALHAAGWWVQAASAGDRHWLDLSNMDHDGWWESRPGALKNTVKRKAKKGIVDLALFSAFDAEAWAAYETIYAASWKPEEGDAALLRAFAESESARGTFRMGLAGIEHQPVAAQFWTV